MAEVALTQVMTKFLDSSHNTISDIHSLHEKCGIFAIHAPNQQVARIAHAGLWSLQHRGQEGTGIAVANIDSGLNIKKGSGLVSQVYSNSDLAQLQGHAAIGHNRYATSGGKSSHHTQPVLRPGKLVALAHNGNIPDLSSLQNYLKKLGIATQNSNDSEMITDALSYHLVTGRSLVEAVKTIFDKLTGAFSIVALTATQLVAFRDAHGIRPLCMGTLGADGVIFSSENCVFPIIGAKFEREISPAELVCVDATGVHSQQLATGNSKLDIFEFVYFARADSSLMGKRVNEVRREFGRTLAREAAVVNADVVVAVPDSAFPAAEGYAEVSGTILQNGFIKNGYVHRTFISPGQASREQQLAMKLNPIPEVVGGKSVVLIDDSLVRGTTTKYLVKLLKKAGARQVHVRISSPPVIYPDFYGINTPIQSKLLAARYSKKQIAKYIGAESLEYLSFSAMITATGLPESVFCTSCFTGKYPVSIGKHAQGIK